MSKYYAMLGWDEALGAPTAFVGVLGIELSSRQMLHWWLPAAVDQSRRWRERAGALRATLLDRSEVAEDVAAQMLQQWQQEAGTLALVSLQPLEEALNRDVMRSAVDLVLSSYGSMAWT